MMPDASALVRRALAARRFSYAPYSHYRVGAALLCADGRVYTGCNVENGAYSPSLCAERTAIAKAISDDGGLDDNLNAGLTQGGSAGRDWQSYFKAIAIVGAPAERQGSDLCTPCGVCRQVMAEFCAPDFKVICATTDEAGEIKELRQWQLKDLLPEAFSL